MDVVQAELHARKGGLGLSSRIEAVRTEFRTCTNGISRRIDSLHSNVIDEKLARVQVVTNSIMVIAMALMFTIYGLLKVGGVIP